MARDALKNMAYDYLYECIVSYKLQPGEVIVEQEISDLLGISRTPVREALKILEAEGLVRHIPARGTFVQDLSAQDVEEIFELREIFEENALRSAIHLITDQELDEIERLLLSLNDNSAPEDFYNSDRSLHNMIISKAENRRMVAFLNNINSQLERLRRISALTPKRLEKSKTEHLDIICAIRERNLDKALRALRLHLRNVKKSTLEVSKRFA